MKVKGTVTEYKEFSVKKQEVVQALLKDYGWKTDSVDDFITIKTVDNKECIVKMSDHFYHGSPDYQIDRIISSSLDDIKLYKLLKKLENIIDSRKKAGID